MKFLFFIFSLFLLPLDARPSLSELTLEEKIGQLLMVHFHGSETNEEALHLVTKLHVGGIIYYNWANGLTSPEQVRQLSEGLQKLSNIPLLIATDQEGGLVNRLKKGFTVFPGNYALAMTGNYQWGKEAAKSIGEEMKSVGIFLNLAPVLDVCSNRANPIIGIRSFSSDPEEVARWGEAALQGYQEAGIACAFKHFPGHGDVTEDSHETLPVVLKSAQELNRVELFPFRKLAGKADVILTAHLKVPALDLHHCATLSKKIVDDLLRKEMHFEGVVITDSFAMEGILTQCNSIEEAVLESLEAGHDMILLGGKQLLSTQQGFELSVFDINRIYHFLVTAAKEGRLSMRRIDESVERILNLKEKLGLFDEVIGKSSSTEKGKALADQIARKSLRMIQGEAYLPLQKDNLLIVAPEYLKEQIDETFWAHFEILYFKELNPDEEFIQNLEGKLSKGQKCLFFSCNAWRFKNQQRLFQKIIETSACPLAIVVRDPLDIDFLTDAKLLLCTYSPVSCSLQAAYDFLFEHKSY